LLPDFFMLIRAGGAWMRSGVILYGALGVPVLLLLMGGVVKKLIRGHGWLRDDFFVGVDLALTALGADLAFLADKVLPLLKTNSGLDKPTLLAMGAILPGFVVLLVMAADEQDCRQLSARARLLRLGVLSNGFGFFLLVAFIYWIQGVA
jgi:hypothetical protein